MRAFLLIASAVLAFAATMTVETTDANAVAAEPEPPTCQSSNRPNSSW